MPVIAGTLARPPTLMKICGASSSLAPTRTACWPSKRACPSMTVTPGVSLSQSATPSRDFRTTASLRALTAAMSTRTPGGTTTPQSPPRARDVRRPRARDQRLGRDAAVVDARAADQLALDDRGLAAGLGEPHGERGACLPGADDDGVVVVAHRMLLPQNASRDKMQSTLPPCNADQRATNALSDLRRSLPVVFSRAASSADSGAPDQRKSSCASSARNRDGWHSTASPARLRRRQ